MTLISPAADCECYLVLLRELRNNQPRLSVSRPHCFGVPLRHQAVIINGDLDECLQASRFLNSVNAGSVANSTSAASNAENDVVPDNSMRRPEMELAPDRWSRQFGSAMPDRADDEASNPVRRNREDRCRSRRRITRRSTRRGVNSGPTLSL